MAKKDISMIDSYSPDKKTGNKHKFFDRLETNSMSLIFILFLSSPFLLTAWGMINHGIKCGRAGTYEANKINTILKEINPCKVPLGYTAKFAFDFHEIDNAFKGVTIIPDSINIVSDINQRDYTTIEVFALSKKYYRGIFSGPMKTNYKKHTILPPQVFLSPNIKEQELSIKIEEKDIKCNVLVWKEGNDEIVRYELVINDDIYIRAAAKKVQFDLPAFLSFVKSFRPDILPIYRGYSTKPPFLRRFYSLPSIFRQ